MTQYHKQSNPVESNLREIKKGESVFDSFILTLTDEVAVNPFDISGLEYSTCSKTIYGVCTSATTLKRGTTIVLKSGHELFCADLTLTDIRNKIDKFLQKRLEKNPVNT